MNLSEKAWKISFNTIQAIKEHPFNQELMQGILKRDKFAYYIEQDSLYLQDFARCLAIIASKIELKYVRTFLSYSEQVFITEQEVVHKFYRKHFNFKETGLITPATLSYTNFLLSNCLQESSEISVAAILPCFWVYREVGNYIAKKTEKMNPYSRWIATYVSEEFSTSVNELIAIFDIFGERTTNEIRDKMLDVFYKSVCLELHFWNDSYYKVVFDNIEKYALTSKKIQEIK